MEGSRRADGFMDRPGEGGVVPVLCADDDAPVLRQGAVESQEFFGVKRATRQCDVKC